MLHQRRRRRDLRPRAVRGSRRDHDLGGYVRGIDLALHLTAKLAGERIAQAAHLVVEYDPDPPFDTGGPDKAGPDLQRLALELLAGSTT